MTGGKIHSCVMTVASGKQVEGEKRNSKVRTGHTFIRRESIQLTIHLCFTEDMLDDFGCIFEWSLLSH